METREIRRLRLMGERDGLQRRITDLNVAVGSDEERSVPPEMLAQLEGARNRLQEVQNQLTALATEAANNINEEEEEPAVDTTDNHQRSNDTRYNLEAWKRSTMDTPNMRHEKGDMALRSWLRAGTPFASDQERRAAAQLGNLNGIELRAPANPANSITTAVGGNHLVAGAFYRHVVESLRYYCPWLDSGATIVNTSSDGPVRVPRSADAYGPNAEAVIINEKIEDTEKPVEFDEITLDVATLTSGLVYVSWEALQDSAIDIPMLLGRQLGERIGRGLSKYIATGSGGTGAFGAGFLGQTIDAKQVQKAGTATAVKVADLVKLIGKIDRAYAGPTGTNGSLRFVMNLATLTSLRGETTSGSGEFLLTNAETGSVATILGIPVIVDNNVEAPAAGKNSVFLVDISRNLFIRHHAGIMLKRSSDYAFAQRSDAFVALARFGAFAGVDPKSVAVLQG
jgi:HK97 family phage major capsid protein